MNDRQMLLRAILENPACDTARLVFADWLMENGQAVRGKYIRRVLLNLPKRMGSGPWASWNRGLLLAYCCQRVTWTRGFVSHIELSTAAFLQHAEAIFRQHPITSVRLTDREPEPWPSYYCWRHTDDNHWPRHADELPMCLFRLLSGTTGETDADCHRHLSAACVAYGRSLAGLPPL